MIPHRLILIGLSLVFRGKYIYIYIPPGQYLNLDKDHNGMLSKEELSRYGTATLTPVFLDRVFQEYLTYDGEMVRTLYIFITVLM